MRLTLMFGLGGHEDYSRLAQAAEAAGKELGGAVKIAGYERFQLGEGIEKESSDFAAEVAATLKTDA